MELNKNTEYLKLIVISILVIGTIVTTISPASADLFDNMDASVRAYNNNVDMVPGIVRSLLGNEETYIVVNMENGKMLEAKMVMKDAKIVQFERIIGFDESATIKVVTDEQTVRNIMGSADPISAFTYAMDNGALKVEGTGIVMYAIIKSLAILMGISKLIGSIVGMIRSIF